MALEFGQWLKRRRRILDLTQDDLAERAFCSVNTIRKIESGDLTPSKTLAQEIARALDLPPETHAEFLRFARTPHATAPENAFLTAGVAALPTSAPPPESPPPAPTVKFHAPAPLTSAIGREHDTGVVTRVLRLPATRLVTLTGPPGTGKTRLALEIVNELQDEFEHGASFVALAPVSQLAQFESAIAQALDVRSTAQMPLTQALRAFLREKQLLLVLDNFEHILDAAPIVTDLLTNAPRLKILATSRERLRVYGEREIPVTPLDVPSLAPLPPWSELEGYSAVQLFIERAQAVKAGFTLTSENAAAVARLCVGLDGLPLAIEMAAARVKWEMPQQLLTQLARRLEIQAGSTRDLAKRQQTLRSTLDWSYGLLDDQEKFVLRHLGIFRGSFTEEAASAVCGFSTGAILETLVEKSLVKQEHNPQQGTSYSLLEIIRKYALENLEAEKEEEAARQRHWEFYYALAQTMGTDMSRIESVDAFDRLKRAQDNLNSALQWAITTQRARQALELAASVAPFWYHASAIAEGVEQLEQVLAMNSQISDDLIIARARARNVFADFLRLDGDLVRAQAMGNQAIADWRSLGETDKAQLAFALLGMARTAWWVGDQERALSNAREALGLFESLNDLNGQATAWRRLGECALHQLDYTHARECLDRSLELTNQTGNLFGQLISYLERGDIARAVGDLDGALADYEQAAKVNEVAREFFPTLRLMHRFGVIATLRGDPVRGEELLSQALRIATERHTRFNVLLVFAGLAMCMALQERPAEAMRWTGLMEKTIESFHAVLRVPDILEHAKTMELLKQQATPEQLEVWRREGQALTLEQAVGLVR